MDNIYLDTVLIYAHLMNWSYFSYHSLKVCHLCLLHLLLLHNPKLVTLIVHN